MKRTWTSGAVEAPDRRILRRRIPRKKSAVMKKWKMQNQKMRMKKIRWTSLAIVDPLRQLREQTALTIPPNCTENFYFVFANFVVCMEHREDGRVISIKH